MTANLTSLNSLKAESVNGSGGASSIKTMPRLKIKFAYKLLAFVISVVALSWFFEGTRQIQAGLSVSAIVYLLAGGVGTVALIGVQAFFIYAEEKSKDNRTRKIPLFDGLYDRMSKQDSAVKQNNSTDIEGDKTNRG